MPEEITIYELIQLIVAIATLAGIIVAVFKFTWKKGQDAGIDKACGERIEKEVKDLKEKFDNEVKNTDESHRRIHQRIDETNNSVNLIKTDVAYIKGKIDQVLK